MLDVRLFLNNQQNSNRVAGGYLTVANLIKTHFSLLRTKSGDGLFVSFPSYQGKDGEWKNYVDSVNREAREQINAAVIDEYNKQRNGGSSSYTPPQVNNSPDGSVVQGSGERNSSIPINRPF